jgi:hypothetical protein
LHAVKEHNYEFDFDALSRYSAWKQRQNARNDRVSVQSHVTQDAHSSRSKGGQGLTVGGTAQACSCHCMTKRWIAAQGRGSCTRALILDLSIMGTSTWLVALAFVEPRLNVSLTPFHLDSQIWVGLLSVATFFMTIVQFKTDWKGRADAHKRSLEVYAEVKREAGYFLAGGASDEAECRRVLGRYDMASALAIEVPEREFLIQKRRHKLKIALSKHLDTHPSASLLLTRIKFWIKDNLGRSLPDAG